MKPTGGFSSSFKNLLVKKDTKKADGAKDPQKTDGAKKNEVANLEKTAETENPSTLGFKPGSTVEADEQSPKDLIPKYKPSSHIMMSAGETSTKGELSEVLSPSVKSQPENELESPKNINQFSRKASQDSSNPFSRKASEVRTSTTSSNSTITSETNNSSISSSSSHQEAYWTSRKESKITKTPEQIKLETEAKKTKAIKEAKIQAEAYVFLGEEISKDYPLTEEFKTKREAAIKRESDLKAESKTENKTAFSDPNETKIAKELDEKIKPTTNIKINQGLKSLSDLLALTGLAPSEFKKELDFIGANPMRESTFQEKSKTSLKNTIMRLPDETGSDGKVYERYLIKGKKKDGDGSASGATKDAKLDNILILKDIENNLSFKQVVTANMIHGATQKKVSPEDGHLVVEYDGKDKKEKTENKALNNSQKMELAIGWEVCEIKDPNLEEDTGFGLQEGSRMVVMQDFAGNSSTKSNLNTEEKNILITDLLVRTVESEDYPNKLPTDVKSENMVINHDESEINFIDSETSEARTVINIYDKTQYIVLREFKGYVASTTDTSSEEQMKKLAKRNENSIVFSMELAALEIDYPDIVSTSAFQFIGIGAEDAELKNRTSFFKTYLLLKEVAPKRAERFKDAYEGKLDSIYDLAVQHATALPDPHKTKLLNRLEAKKESVDKSHQEQYENLMKKQIKK